MDTAKLSKLLAYSLDRAATEAEAVSAAGRLIALARAKGLTPSQFVSALGPAPTATQAPRPCGPFKPPSHIDAEMPFGRYRGFRLSQIYFSDRQYLYWLLNQRDLRGNLRSAILALLAYYARQSRAI